MRFSLKKTLLVNNYYIAKIYIDQTADYSSSHIWETCLQAASIV